LLTTEDGLPRNQVHRIVEDRAGYLWFLSSEALARFDGQFVQAFGPEQGFPRDPARDFLQGADGTYWILTDRELFALAPPGAAVARASRVDPASPLSEAARLSALYETRDGALWVGGTASAYRLLGEPGGRWLQAEDLLAAGLPPVAQVTDFVEHPAGMLWAATSHGLCRRDAAGAWTRAVLPEARVQALATDGPGRLWIATDQQVCALEPCAADAVAPPLRCYAAADGLAIGVVEDLLTTADGGLWVAGVEGIALGTRDASGRLRFRSYGAAEGWPTTLAFAVAEDHAGNIWFGTESAGAVRLARGGLTTFGRTDGLAEERVDAIFENGAGALYVITGLRFLRVIAAFDGRGFTSEKPRLPSAVRDLGWGTHQIAVVDREGDWWIATGEGVARWRAPVRFEDLARRFPDVVYGTREGLPGPEVFRVFEDRHGDVWIGTITEGRNTLCRFSRRDETCRVFGPADGAPPSAPTAFEEDRFGTLWVGFYDGGLARVRGDRLQFFAPGEGGPQGLVWDLHRDARGRLWVGSSRSGLAQIEGEDGEQPRFVRWTTAQGMSSDNVHCVVDDDRGRIYMGTPRGIDRLDPATGEIARYTTADGLANSESMVAHKDRSGALWFGTLNGLSRLPPGPDSVSPAPLVRITSLSVAGTPRALDPLGVAAVEGLVLGPGERQIDVEISGLYLAPGGPLRFQYRLEGAEGDWSSPSSERVLHFANLAPGHFRLLVRALAPGGVASAQPAVVTFEVLRPVWQRWYSVVAATLVVAAALFGAHRVRVRRLLELERMRTRIATDLHDDVGATLSHIAILGEVARREAGPGNERLGSLLDRIATAAGEMVDTMSDIVWSIHPDRDRLADLVGRMRRFGGELMSARGIEFEFRAPAEAEQRPLGVDVRRELLLVFKEALNNAAKHSEASHVEAELRLGRRTVVLAVADDGRGIDQAAPREGHGLASLRRRAEALAGTCRIDSTPGQGTRIEVELPLGRRGRFL
jgi:signal transduction histidine kinase